MRFRASEAARAIGARLIGPDVVIEGAAFDSRVLRRGQLFVPIVAERDGHEFIGMALADGASAYLTSRDPVGGTALRVADTAQALLDLARWARGRLSADVVGITGSVGKTSTKDFTAAAVATGRRVTANERSFNNDQGLPITILNAPDDTEVAVVEMGMRGFGEIARLCDVARPTVGVVTCVGQAHTERVGGIEGVARAKGELVEALSSAGTAVLNADDHRVAAMRSRTSAQVLTYGQHASADVRLVDLRLDALARAHCRALTPWGEVELRLAMAGAHMAMNAAAALAVAGVLGVPISAAATALGVVEVSAMRMDLTRLSTGAVVIDDSYNANPTSMAAALRSLAAIDAERRVAVVGVMAELDDAAAGHDEIARLADELGIELVAVGTDLYGITPVDDPVVALGSLAAGDAVLVKGSRVAGLEVVARRLIEEGGRAES